MKAKLPNLELLEYIARSIVFNNEKAMEKIKIRAQNMGMPARSLVSLEASVFLQMWGSTCTAFDVDENGNAMIGGCAMTEAYTTVFYERCSDMYIVFVDNRLCYIVNNATEEFYKDLREQQLKTLSEAKKCY